MSWLILLAAIAFEVIGTTCMKLSDGFTRYVPAIFMFVFYLASIAALSVTLKKIEVGIAYAVWSGVGTALIAVIGIVCFREQLTILKIGGLLLVIGGAVILNLASNAH
jgi:small multidrug resistance pump